MAAPELADVLRHPAIWRGDGRMQHRFEVIKTGYAALDHALPDGGWQPASMAEILVAKGAASGELSLLWPALQDIGRQRELVLVAPPCVPYAPAWQQAGIDLARLVWVRPASAGDTLWAMEQALREPACGAVLGWVAGVLDDRSCRRLQLAAKAGGGLGFLLRPPQRESSSPLPLRIEVEAAQQGWCVHVRKRRGLPLTEPLFVTRAEVHHALAGHRHPDAATARLSAPRR
ncbi:translesion DNA synthesis-associated protein ImuA [Amantichitinum ursilacus]|uniref:SOS cell division inhibitor n=1 Tax=Amantichitinum ursilacus TaxID=857265 RepID=A0A0N0XKN1_9NEIS|nr:translesion DNA synthesis-associated protein ImuA [Amantichitinum ursilacus]KPC54827.1 SOS cell division inhibitor [Amantichitinum ursilacus]